MGTVRREPGRSGRRVALPTPSPPGRQVLASTFGWPAVASAPEQQVNPTMTSHHRRSGGNGSATRNNQSELEALLAPDIALYRYAVELLRNRSLQLAQQDLEV